MRLSSERLVVGAILAMSLVTLALQAVMLRPHLWPAGAGLALTGETVMATLAAPRPVAVIRPPDVSRVSRAHVTVARVWPGGTADRAGVQQDMPVGAIVNGNGERVSLTDGLPADTAGVLRVWRDMHRLRPGSAITIDVGGRTVVLEQPAIWSTGGDTLGPWLRLHLGPLAQMTAFLAGAATLLFLGTSGITATLMTLALIGTAAANGGPLLGAEMAIPILGPFLLFFNWIVTPLSFPIIGLAMLYFPRKAAILDRHRWIVPALGLASLPMLVISVASAAFLLGSDSMLPALTWLAERAWTFELCRLRSRSPPTC